MTTRTTRPNPAPASRRSTSDPKPDPSYGRAVKAAATCLVAGEDANWELARLTFEACGPAAGRTGRPTKNPQSDVVTLTQWSADVREASGRRFSISTASHYRQVHERFGADRELDPSSHSWTEAWNAVLGRESRGDPAPGDVARHDAGAAEHVPTISAPAHGTQPGRLVPMRRKSTVVLPDDIGVLIDAMLAKYGSDLLEALIEALQARLKLAAVGKSS